MTLVKRQEFLTSLQNPSFSLQSQVVLFFGERYLCKEAADLLQERLLTQGPGAVHNFDGDQEDAARTLSLLQSFSLLPGTQLFRVTDSRILHSKTVLSTLWQRAAQAQKGGNDNLARKQLLAMIEAAGLKPEDPLQLSEMTGEEWQATFGFVKPSENLQWIDQLLDDVKQRQENDSSGLVERYITALDKGIPKNNILILTAETIDKRHKFFVYLKKTGTIVDCSVTSGSSTAAQTEQKEVLLEMMQKTLARYSKKIEPRAVEMLFERVGFHPVAMVVETEKLIHYADERVTITTDDVETMVARTREDAIFELTDALGKRQVDKVLTLFSRMCDQGIHELAILAALRNYLRKHLIFRAIQMRDFPVWRNGMSARDFQNTYLPALKSEEELKDLFTGHPYALYMSFIKASEYSCSGLKRWLSMLLEAEFKLKGSSLPPRLVIEELLVAMLRGTAGLPGRRDLMV